MFCDKVVKPGVGFVFSDRSIRKFTELSGWNDRGCHTATMTCSREAREAREDVRSKPPGRAWRRPGWREPREHERHFIFGRSCSRGSRQPDGRPAAGSQAASSHKSSRA
jgi:hypothetical protein